MLRALSLLQTLAQSPQPNSSSQETTSRGATQREITSQETTSRGTASQEAFQQEATPQEATSQKAASQEAFQQETTSRKITSREAASQEATSQDALFTAAALEVFRYQALHNPIYASYLQLLGVAPGKVTTLAQIPHLPIAFFKSHHVYAATTPPEVVFTSSATTGMVPSQHPVAHTALYRESVRRSFSHFYGAPEDYVILALLPNYLERQGSSLVYMAQYLMELSGHPQNGFYLYNHAALYATLQECRARGLKTWLIGVSFALLDFCASYPIGFPQLTVLETGGMKGRREELSRSELHHRLRQGFPQAHIHSEYGMAELLSQAYCTGGTATGSTSTVGTPNGSTLTGSTSTGSTPTGSTPTGGTPTGSTPTGNTPTVGTATGSTAIGPAAELFACPPWMRVHIRNLQDPFAIEPCGVRGGINIIDLANYYSCAFIETEDLGIAAPNGNFCVLGRIPHAERRGCNMLLES